MPKLTVRYIESLRVNLYTLEFRNEIILFVISTIFFQAARLFVTLLVARWVGPEEFGIWNALSLFLIYGIVFSLGVPNGMNRLVPLLNGMGKEEKSQALIVTALWFSLLANIVLASLIVGLRISPFWPEKFRDATIALAFLSISWQMYQFFQLILKSRIKFNVMIAQQILFAVLLLITALPLAYQYGIRGFILAQSVTSMLAIGYIIYRLRFIVPFKFEISDLWMLIKNGLPIMTAGLLYTLLLSVDRWIIIINLGAEALGNYTLSIQCLGLLSLIPAAISQQLYPRMAYSFGRNSKVDALTNMIKQQSWLSGGTSWLLIFVMYFTLPTFINTFLPAYVGGIHAARITLLGLLPLSLVGGFANFLNAIGKQIYYMVIQFITLLIGIVVMNGLILWRKDITSVAAGMALTYCFYFVALAILSIAIILNERKKYADSILV